MQVAGNKVKENKCVNWIVNADVVSRKEHGSNITYFVNPQGGIQKGFAIHQNRIKNSFLIINFNFAW